MPDLPPGVAIENVWAIEASYPPDVLERRAPVRARHLERIARLQREGVVIAGGAFADLSGSLLLVRFPDEDAVREFIESDIYWSSGVWTDYRSRPFGLVRLADA